MKTKIIALTTMLVASPVAQTFACAVCFGAKDSKATEHIAVAIWVMLGAIMSVLSGVGAFSFHLWRHANTPLEPHQELAQEDFQKYE